MLENLLRQEIHEKGPLSQYQFMEVALQHPEFGYYRSQEAISRDFTTSPEISQVFGELLGAWAIDYFLKLNQPKNLSLIELGPGKGTLLTDFLRIVSQISMPFLEALDITLVEINPLLKTIQQNTIPCPIKWVEHVEHIPLSDAPLMILANEFFDVLPTHCYIRKENKLYERCLILKEDKLTFAPLFLQENQGPDQTWEESPKAESLIHTLCDRLLMQSGVFLCIDYGYEKGAGDSLQALFKGEPSDPLSHIGKSDLTCHVHFGRFKDIALSKGLGVLGPLPQGQFLKNIGLETRIERLKHKNPLQRAPLEVASRRLSDPRHMGALFKVMAIFSSLTLIPAGFES